MHAISVHICSCELSGAIRFPRKLQYRADLPGHSFATLPCDAKVGGQGGQYVFHSAARELLGRMLGEDGQGCQRAPACVIKDTLTPCLLNWCQTAASQLGWEMTARRHHLSPHGSLDFEVPSCVPSDGVRDMRAFLLLG